MAPKKRQRGVGSSGAGSGGGSDPQPQPTQGPVTPTHLVMIVGHSFVFWAHRYAINSGWTLHLGLGDAVTIRWLGKRGMRWPALWDTVAGAVHEFGTPAVLVVHLGGNDLPGMKGVQLINVITEDLKALQLRLPETQIIWSSIVERLAWRGARSPLAVNRTVRKVNKVVFRAVTKWGCRVLDHANIHSAMPGLYRNDGVHLSSRGLDTWLEGIRATLQLSIQTGALLAGTRHLQCQRSCGGIGTDREPVSGSSIGGLNE
ncbi:uncharacterized protein LOC143837288 isoform X2 [Paroedura picta]|uniref:uncharacterized protein LOC143837288 isoform X2 n=1 Tax=Paroedura picta TaxID=143630 RepID=UPI004056E97F